ncbi:MAG: molybdopterin-guanine dinucleotide biosynthesis protein B [Candidatus Methanoperedenaceae archaeon]|nr:MAG: molybdopterin-guanine dinucleotide biosynthesis protein B [Candidatus Methanoperedenaceae archaeon]
MPPVICIVGTSKTGKTKLMEELIKDLKGRGLKVGALKSHKHGDFEIDVKGKDTWKYANAGADTVAITSSVKFAVIKNENVMTDIDEICETYFFDTDVVLADGFTQSDKPRIIVVENEQDAGFFERGCRVISITDEKIKDLKSVFQKVLEFLET